MKILYPASIVFDKNDQRHLVTFSDFPEALTEGETIEEALFNAVEVLTLTLEGRIDEGMEIPLPVLSMRKKNVYLVAPSARVQAALLMRLSKAGRSTAHLARALQTSWPAAARLEDPHHWPSLKQLERAANAMGQSLRISLEAQ